MTYLARRAGREGLALSGETEKDVSAWTIDSLHSHFIQLRRDDRDRLDDLRKDDQVAIAALASSKDAIAAALERSL